MFKTLSPDLIRRRLTSLFPTELIEDTARERDVVQRDRKIDITMLVWTLIMGFAVDGEARTIAGFQRAYSAATNQTVACSSFYDQFTPALAALLSDLLEHSRGGRGSSHDRATVRAVSRRADCRCNLRAISLPERRLRDVLGDLSREIIDVTVEIEFKRRAYAGKQSTDSMEFRVVGVRNEDTDDYHLYVTNLPDEFTPRQVGALYGLRWEVELLFRELKSLYGLEKFQTSDPAIVELLVVAALLTRRSAEPCSGCFRSCSQRQCFRENAGRRPSGLSPSSSSKIWPSRSAIHRRTCRN